MVRGQIFRTVGIGIGGVANAGRYSRAIGGQDGFLGDAVSV